MSSCVLPSLARAGAAHAHRRHAPHAAGAAHAHAAHAAQAHVAHAAHAHAAAGHCWNNISQSTRDSPFRLAKEYVISRPKSNHTYETKPGLPCIRVSPGGSGRSCRRTASTTCWTRRRSKNATEKKATGACVGRKEKKKRLTFVVAAEAGVRGGGRRGRRAQHGRVVAGARARIYGAKDHERRPEGAGAAAGAGRGRGGLTDVGGHVVAPVQRRGRRVRVPRRLVLGRRRQPQRQRRRGQQVPLGAARRHCRHGPGQRTAALRQGRLSAAVRTLTGGGVQALVQVLQLHLVVVDPQVRGLDGRRRRRLLVRAGTESAT